MSSASCASWNCWWALLLHCWTLGRAAVEPSRAFGCYRRVSASTWTASPRTSREWRQPLPRTYRGARGGRSEGGQRREVSMMMGGSLFLRQRAAGHLSCPAVPQQCVILPTCWSSHFDGLRTQKSSDGPRKGALRSHAVRVQSSSDACDSFTLVIAMVQSNSFVDYATKLAASQCRS